ncbi:Phage transcriptional regulator, Cro/CI family [Brachybacterium faecium]|nr:Phage transcriptional regulator, Cro/CI family [Brachybacterium faecium]
MIVEKIKKLCEEQKITFAELERKIDLSNGQIARWKKQNAGIDKLQKVADYFNVSIDYLLSRTEKRYLEKNSDIGYAIEDIINNAKNSSKIKFFDQNISTIEKEKLLSSIIIALELNKK